MKEFFKKLWTKIKSGLVSMVNQWHLMAGLMVGTYLTLILHSLTFGIVITLALGIAKYIYDKKKGKEDASLNDVLFVGAGGVVGSGLGFLISLLF